VKSRRNKRLVVRSQKDSKDAGSKNAGTFSRHQTTPAPAIEQTQREDLSWERGHLCPRNTMRPLGSILLMLKCFFCYFQRILKPSSRRLSRNRFFDVFNATKQRSREWFFIWQP
jgi:hypothetical protein